MFNVWQGSIIQSLEDVICMFIFVICLRTIQTVNYSCIICGGAYKLQNN